MPMKVKAIFALAAVASGLTLVAFAQQGTPQPGQKAEKATAAQLEGRYTLVSGEKDGKPEPAEKIKGSVVVFTADKIVGTDKDKKEFFAASYTLDTTKKPWVIKMKSLAPKEGAESVGLVKVEGDSVTLVYSLPGVATPTEFKTKDKQHLFVLKRVGAKDEPTSPGKR